MSGMRVLPLDVKDPWVLKTIHGESGFDYQFPKDLNTPLFPIRRAVVDDSNWPIAAAALKVEAEAYLWLDPRTGGPETRLQAIKMLNDDLAEQARMVGFDQVHCALPPEIAERFGKRLEELGWKLARPWPLYVFQLR